jgi:hypothetical protein
LAALPRQVWPSSASEFDAAGSRIVQLDAERAVGSAWWWLWRLKASEFAERSSASPDFCSSVFTTDGLEATANAWLPSAEDYDGFVLSEPFDRLTLAGFAVTIRHVPRDAPGSFEKLPAVNQRLLLELETAALGISPAILAAMLVHSNDNYAIHEGTPASASHDVSELPSLSGDPGNVLACVTVTQAHSFRLTELLDAYNRVAGDPVLRPTLQAFDGTVFELTMAVARRVRALANHRVLKLNVTPEAVVFCPRLTEDASGDLQAHGYGHESLHAARGVPFLFDFDPLHTKRFGTHADYDADSAYVVMMLTLLASVRAQHGEAVSNVMANRLRGLGVNGAALGADELPEDFHQYGLAHVAQRCREKADTFAAAVRNVLPSWAKEHKALLGAAYSEAADDFAELIRTETLVHWSVDDKPVFSKLVQHLTASSTADTSLFNEPTPAQEAALEQERARRVERRLDAVREARMRARVGAR